MGERERTTTPKGCKSLRGSMSSTRTSNQEREGGGGQRELQGGEGGEETAGGLPSGGRGCRIAEKALVEQ